MKPECRQYQEWMAEAFGEELDPARLPGLETHLTSCAECQAAWEDYRLLRRGLDVLAEEDSGLSPFVEAKILRAAASRNAAKAPAASFWRWLLRPATIGFATLALMAGIGYLGREELLRHRRSEDLTVPTERRPVIPAPAEEAKPPAAPPAPVAAPAPASAQVPAELQSSETATKPKAKAVAKPAPALEERAAPPASAPALLPAPSASSTGSGATLKGNEGRARETNIPEAQFATPPAPKEEAEKKVEQPSATEPAPAKTLQRAAPQPGAAPSEKVEGEAGLAQKESADESGFDRLLRGAKAKIKRQDYAGALEDLLAAQKIRDSKEIQDLILLCRSHLRGDG